MIRRLFLLFTALAAAFAYADESYLSLFMQGKKIGYVSTNSTQAKLDGKAVAKTQSRMLIDAGILGQSMKVQVDSATYSRDGVPVLMTFLMESAGRRQDLNARFSKTEAKVTVKNGGSVTTKVLKLPTDGKVVDDAIATVWNSGVVVGKSKSFYVLDPMTVSLVKNTVSIKGKTKTVVKGLSFDAVLVEIAEPRYKTNVYMSGKGDLIKVEGLLGIEMIPASKEEALKKDDSNTGIADIAVLSSIKTDKPLGEISDLSSAKLRFRGANLKLAPSDAHQSVTADGANWVVQTHPVVPDASASVTIAAAAKAAPDWVKPGLHLPSDSEQFKTLAREIVGNTTNVVTAAQKVRAYVTHNMRGNAGIGVLRDAGEILKTKEGVCRDYAVLTATLLRAAGIPARLASGLVYYQGSFYYHAWVEAFDGKRWFGLDSTRGDGRVTAGHIKLAQGNVEDAFLFIFLDRATVEVLETKGTEKSGGTR